MQHLEPALRCCRTSYTAAGAATLKAALLSTCDLLLPPPGLQRCYRPAQKHPSQKITGDEVIIQPAQPSCRTSPVI